jgi:ATP-binding protein involved in chromosome partitioning
MAENPQTPLASDRRIKHAIAVASGKGGVGKTTLAVNLAVALSESGAKVGLMDADIYGPNVPTMLGVETMPPPNPDKIVPAEAYGLKLMSIAFMVKPEQPLIWRGPMLHSAIRQFVEDVEWGDLDYLIIDLPPGTGDAPLSVAQSIPLTGTIIVTLPQQVSLDDARRGLEMFKTMQVPILGIVENMSYLKLPDGNELDIFGQGGGQTLATESGSRYLGGIPMDPHVRVGGDSGVPIVIAHPESEVSQSIREITNTVVEILGEIPEEQTGTIPIEIID